jgi:putative NIF3 family GTP cyclohydrolase 1 type 2
MKHHEALRAAAVGMTVVCTLHSNSERAVLRRLADRLRQTLPSLEILISQHDRDPFIIR